MHESQLDRSVRRTFALLAALGFLAMAGSDGCSKPADRRVEKPVAVGAISGAPSEAGPCDCPPASGGQQSEKRPPLTPEKRKEAIERLTRDFETLDGLTSLLPRRPYDPRAIVDEVGTEPADLVRWVQERTRLVPYRGVLRGVKGVLMDGLGNSLDRSLLLHELLRLAGWEARLARGTLSAEKAGALLAAGRGPTTVAGDPAQGPAATDEELVERFGSGLEEFRKGQPQRLRDAQATAREIGARVDAQTDFILKKIPRVRGSGDPPEPGTGGGALRDHWWVQWRDEGQWKDLDPTSTAMATNGTLTAVDETCRPDEIDERAYHRVALRVVIEQWAGGRTSKKTVLDRTLRAADLIGERIRLGHSLLDPAGDPDLWRAIDPAESLNSYALGVKKWKPVLSVGSEQISRSSFNAEGEVDESPGRSASSGVGGLAGGFSRALAGGESAAKASAGSLLVAEWIEFEILVPESSARKVRRTVFDLLGPAPRAKGTTAAPALKREDLVERGLALLGEHEIFVQVCRVPAEYALRTLADDLLANRDTFLELIEGQGSSDSAVAGRLLKDIQPLPGPGLYYAMARSAWGRSPDPVFLGQPNIVDFVRELRLGADGKPHGRTGLDIITNEVEVVPGSADDPYTVRVRQGVLDTNAEAYVMRGVGRVPDNAAVVFDRSKGSGWRAFRSVGDPGWRGAALPEDVRAEIERELREGFAVLLPGLDGALKGRRPTAWWRVDPRSGDVLGLGPGGRGQAMLEHVMLGVHIATFAFCIYESVESMAEGQVATGVLHAAYCVAMIGVTGIVQHAAMADMVLRGASEIPFFFATTIVNILAELGSGMIH